MSLLAAIRSLLPMMHAAMKAPESIAKAPAAEPVQPHRRPTALEYPESPDVTIYDAFLRRSQLAAAASPAIADLIDIIHRDESVQRAAGTCAAKHQRLIELAGYRSEVHAAIHIAIARDEHCDIANITPSMVAEVLRQRAEAIDDAIDDCREDHAAHQASSLKRMTRHQPLRAAVSARLTELANERKHLIAAITAAQNSFKNGLAGNSRFAQLRAAGLDQEAIAKIEPTALDPDSVIDGYRARVAAISPQIEALLSFNASPTFDAAHLAGLEGFDELIAARDGEKATA